MSDKSLKEQIIELKEKTFLQGKIIAKSNNTINELKEDYEAVHQAITNESIVRLRIEKILREFFKVLKFGTDIDWNMLGKHSLEKLNLKSKKHIIRNYNDTPDYYLPWCKSCSNKNNWFDGCKTCFQKENEEPSHYKTEPKKYQLKFKDIIVDVIDIMGYNKDDEEVKQIREYLEGIDNEYVLTKYGKD